MLLHLLIRFVVGCGTLSLLAFVWTFVFIYSESTRDKWLVSVAMAILLVLMTAISHGVVFLFSP